MNQFFKHETIVPKFFQKLRNKNQKKSKVITFTNVARNKITVSFDFITNCIEDFQDNECRKTQDKNIYEVSIVREILPEQCFDASYIKHPDYISAWYFIQDGVVVRGSFKNGSKVIFSQDEFKKKKHEQELEENRVAEEELKRIVREENEKKKRDENFEKKFNQLLVDMSEMKKDNSDMKKLLMKQ